MDDSFVQLTYGKLALAASLVVISAAISLALRLDLERRLLLAAARTIVQLLLIGMVLQWIFEPGRGWYVIVSLMVMMTLVAGVTATRRSDRGYRGVLLDSVISVWASAWLMTAVAVVGIVQVEPWYRPQYVIPLLGMILHNTLNGISLGLDRFTSDLEDKRDAVETLLALGATRWEAAREAIRQGLRTGMVPTVNTMMVIGIVSLPGMMTGQLLAGVEPMQAVMYQAVIMFLIAAGTSLGTLSVVLLGYFRLFNRHHQFLAAKMSRRR